MVLTGSTVSGNTATAPFGKGGGIANLHFGVDPVARLDLVNSTVSGNSAAFGGGVYLERIHTLITVDFSTIAFNSAMFEGGGMLRSGTQSGIISVSNSIVANNTAPMSPDVGNVSTQDYNHIGNITGSNFIPAAHDVVGTDPQLGVLADNGGSTLTHLPSEISPVIDSIPIGVHGCGEAIIEDQRGATRPFATGCDKGSVEVTIVGPTPTPVRPSRADFDGDHRTDLSVFRPSDGTWYYDGTSQGFAAIQFGQATDIPAPGDFDADGKTDVSVFRPSNGFWYRLNSSDGTFSFVEFGVDGDIPQVGDYDGDSHADQAVFRPSDGTWYWLRSIDGQFAGRQFGQAGDVPAVGDYLGDRRVDLCVYRSGVWYRTAIFDPAVSAENFGAAGDMPVPGDYDADGKIDIAVFRPSDGDWYVHNSSNGSYSGLHWGQAGDVPVPGDYFGLQRDEIAIYRQGTWYIHGGPGGATVMPFGLGDDIPIPKKYIP
jgi:FG-GAP-like repeat